MSASIKVGVAGYGISAQVFHIPFLVALEEFELTTILERTKNEARQKHPSVKIARTIEELVADKETELIVITTPNETHADYAAKALRAGKHVVLEKPFANTAGEAKELIGIARRSGRILSVYQNRRYVSDYLTIKDILAENLLGEVHEFNAHYDRYRAEARPNAWREKDFPGSGILYDLGPHLIDQALSLFALPVAITADIRMQRPHAKVDDYFNLWLDFGFMKAILHAGMLVREPGPRYLIHGTKGSFIKPGEDVQEGKLRAGEQPAGADWGREPEAYHGTLHTEMNGGIVKKTIPSRIGDYGQYYKNIYQSIRHNAPVQEKPEHGYNTIRLIELAIQSHQEKRTLECSDLIDAY